jgi:hypothetical protein
LLVKLVDYLALNENSLAHPTASIDHSLIEGFYKHTMSETKLVPNLHAQSVSTFDAGTLNSDGYGDVSGFTASGIDYEKLVRSEPYVDDIFRKRVLIVGAGITGIQQAAILLDETPIKHEDMIIVDAQEGYSGVWAKNKYPGCACDVPAIIYTTSFFPNKSKTPCTSIPHLQELSKG